MVTAPLLSTAIQNFTELRKRAQQLGPKRVAVVVADDDVALHAAAAATALGIAIPVLIGDRKRIEAKIADIGESHLHDKAEFIDAPDAPSAANAAAQMARDGLVDILLKGHLRTDELLRAALDKQNGLRTGRLLSDVLLYEDVLSGERRLVGITDGGQRSAHRGPEEADRGQCHCRHACAWLCASANRHHERNRGGFRVASIDGRCARTRGHGSSRRIWRGRSLRPPCTR